MGAAGHKNVKWKSCSLRSEWETDSWPGAVCPEEGASRLQPAGDGYEGCKPPSSFRTPQSQRCPIATSSWHSGVTQPPWVHYLDK